MGRAPRLWPSCASRPGLLHTVLLLPRAAPIAVYSPGRDRARTLRGRHAPVSTPLGSPGLPRALLSRLHLPGRATLLLTSRSTLSLAQQQQQLQRTPALATARRASLELARPAVLARR